MKKTGIWVFGILVLLLSAGCGKNNGTKIWDYAPVEEDAQEEGTGEIFAQAVEEYFGKKTETVQNGEAAHGLHIVCDEAAAENLGCHLREWDSNAFALLEKEEDLYLISPTQKGAERAVAYFIRSYVRNDGTVVFPQGGYYMDPGTRVKDEVYVGEVPMGEYTIVCSDASLEPVCRELQYYISQTGGGLLPVQKEASGPAVFLAVDEELEAGKYKIVVEDGTITLTASDADTLYNTVYLFLDTYLGWIKTGTDEAHISNGASVIRVPACVSTAPEPWIEEREAIVVLWNVNFTRGFKLNENVSLQNNIIDFSEDQLYEYVKMLKYCGFTGVQATDMCSAWAGTGGYETVHEKIRTLADAAHSLDMKFTLWVWGAEFSDAGWVDPEVPGNFYGRGYANAYEDPELWEVFDKYYSIYAQLADCCDRVIGHYYDPGNLYTAEDIAFYGNMLKEKFLAVNPDIDFGISCWVDRYDKSVLAAALGTDVTFYECGHHDAESEYVPFRTEISKLGVRLGTWAWNTCEMEIDQLAQMNFNLDIIRSVYQTARNYDSIAKPEYWSEMDSYHLLNVFSLYCAGQMLIDPDVPSETLYDGIATAAVGPEYAEAFGEMLSIIQDARSGSSWDTYFWSNENYILKSPEYPAEKILRRCDEAIPILREMIDSGLESYTLPLPISLQDLLSMMLPHLLQIRDYAEFRMELADLEEAYDQGIPPEDLAERLYEIAKPIPEYNCIMGSWGQIEARTQYEMITAFCGKTGMEIPRYTEFQEERKQYILKQLICYQRESTEPWNWAEPYYQWGLAYGPEETARLVEELVQEGRLERLEDGSVRLKDWENYRYGFLP